ncbi:hypothetical protein LJR129_004941 [Acidovorax sp. LjRoot129]|uniref:hypothetical protein n=1 Tax=unclassified Acidovorax TaxID=2684926 RepID=UPI003ED0D923
MLATLDPHLRAPAGDTIGSMTGDRLHVQWWCDPTGKWFAAQVMDAATQGVWEAFLLPASTGQPLVGRRLCMGDTPASDALDELWMDVFAGLLSETHPAARYPTFSELVAAGSNPAGVTAVREETTLLARLQADVEYWKHLAKSLSKAAIAAESTYSPPPAFLAPPAPPDSAGAPRQWQLKDIAEWAQANEHRIVIMQRAISATKRSTFEQPALLYECLELLANEYTQVKTGKADRNAFRDKARSIGIDFGGSVDPSVAGEMGELYFVRRGGRRRFLDQHLIKGNARDPRFCMRVYFCYDEEEQKVIVGHMPSHLPTSYT